jgi:hypothetical protein
LWFFQMWIWASTTNMGCSFAAPRRAHGLEVSGKAFVPQIATLFKRSRDPATRGGLHGLQVNGDALLRARSRPESHGLATALIVPGRRTGMVERGPEPAGRGLRPGRGNLSTHQRPSVG